MISFRISLLNNFPIIKRCHNNKNLQYFIHNINNNKILNFQYLSHFFIKLILITITFDNKVLIHKSYNIRDNSITKMIIILYILSSTMITCVQIIDKFLHFFITNNKEEFVFDCFYYIVWVF